MDKKAALNDMLKLGKKCFYLYTKEMTNKCNSITDWFLKIKGDAY